jgi:hypothetical protein
LLQESAGLWRCHSSSHLTFARTDQRTEVAGPWLKVLWGGSNARISVGILPVCLAITI